MKLKELSIKKFDEMVKAWQLGYYPVFDSAQIYVSQTLGEYAEAEIIRLNNSVIVHWPTCGHSYVMYTNIEWED